MYPSPIFLCLLPKFFFHSAGLCILFLPLEGSGSSGGMLLSVIMAKSWVLVYKKGRVSYSCGELAEGGRVSVGRCEGSARLSVMSRDAHGMRALAHWLLVGSYNTLAPAAHPLRFVSDTKGLQITSFGWIFYLIAVYIMTSNLLPATVGRWGKTMG